MEFPTEGLLIGQFNQLIYCYMMKFVDDLGNLVDPPKIPMCWLHPMQLVQFLQTYLTANDHLKKSFKLHGSTSNLRTKMAIQCFLRKMSVTHGLSYGRCRMQSLFLNINLDLNFVAWKTNCSPSLMATTVCTYGHKLPRSILLIPSTIHRVGVRSFQARPSLSSSWSRLCMPLIGKISHLIMNFV